MKRLLAVLLSLALLFSCAAAESLMLPKTPDVHQIEKKDFPLCYGSKDTVLMDNVPLYFVDGVDDLPFVDLKDWKDVLITVNDGNDKEKPSGYQLTYEEKGNTVVLTREDGQYTMNVDFENGKIRFLDYLAFLKRPDRMYMDQTNFPLTDKDGKPYLLNYTKSRSLYGELTTIDLDDYMIPMYVQDGKHLLPLQTLAAFTISKAFPVGLYYNGEVLLLNSVDGMTSPYTSFLMKVQLAGLATPELQQKVAAFEGTKEEKEEFVIQEVKNGSEQGAALVEAYEKDKETSPYTLYTSVPKKPRSKALTYFSYRELVLELNCFYGLKEAHQITDFSDFFLQTGLANKLLDPDASVADEGISDLTRLWFDDGHSDFISASCMAEGDPKAQYGFKMEDLTRMATELAQARAKHPESVQPYYEQGDTAYVTFDEFKTTSGDYYELSEKGELPNDTLGLIIQAHRQITREGSPIKNVVLDLSYNGGGALNAALFVLGWYLGDANASFQDTYTGSMSTASVRADVNLDHVFDEQDTLAGRGLNLYCLISPKSFSCGNLVPWAFRADGGVTLLGKISGGGSCVVGFTTTAWGTSYRYSSSTKISFLKNGAYYDVDQGVVPDYFINHYENFYDREKLTEFIHGLY